MNKKTVFDKHLYKEGLRSLLPFGAILLGLLSVFTMLFCAGTLLGNGYSYDELDELLVAFSVILYFAIIVFVVPILSLKSFHFLTTRTGSDFYHSIPHKKQCIFITFALAAFTWVAACTLIPFTIITIVYSFAGGIGFSIMQCINILLHILVAALLVMSAISIACAITGTMITNIITTGLILFFPRIFLYACRIMLAGLTSYFIPVNGFLFGTRCNLVVQAFIGFTNMDYYLFDLKSLLYTFLLCALYVALAIFLFERRHSELAMKPTLSRKFQAFLCILLGTAFSVVPIYIISTSSFRVRFLIRDNLFILVTLYILIIIAMGIYELITTKKARNLVRLIPRVGILAIINIAILGSLYCGKKLILSDVPDASSIKSVSFGFINPDATELLNRSYNDYVTPISTNSNGDSMGYKCSDYFSNKCNSYSTSDETIRKIVADGVDAYSNHKYQDRPKTVLVTVNTGLRSMKRTACLTEDDFATVRNYLLHDDSFMSNYYKLPKTEYISLSGLYRSKQLTMDEMCELYQVASQEIQTLEPEKLLQHLDNSDNDPSAIDHLSFTTTIGSKRTTSSFDINTTLPKTYDKYVTLVNSKNVDMIKDAKDKILTQNEEKTHSYLELQMVGPYDDAFKNIRNHMTTSELKETVVSNFIDSIIAVENETIDPFKTDCRILEFEFNYTNPKNDKTETILKYVQIDQATLKQHSDAINDYYTKKFESN